MSEGSSHCFKLDTGQDHATVATLVLPHYA